MLNRSQRTTGAASLGRCDGVIEAIRQGGSASKTTLSSGDWLDWASTWSNTIDWNWLLAGEDSVGQVAGQYRSKNRSSDVKRPLVRRCILSWIFVRLQIFRTCNFQWATTSGRKWSSTGLGSSCIGSILLLLSPFPLFLPFLGSPRSVALRRVRRFGRIITIVTLSPVKGSSSAIFVVAFVTTRNSSEC